MKKNLLYLFAFVCSLSLFVACSDDDDDDKKEPWKELSKTYQGDKLKINEAEAATGITAEVNAVSEEAATLKLNNIVPEDKTVTIEAKLTKAGSSYNVTGENTVNNCKVSVSGSFTDGVLNLSVSRNLTTAATGEHALHFVTIPTATGMMSLVPVHFKAVTGDPTIDAMIEQANMGGIIGGLIAGKVSAVNVKLPANGVFDVNWTTVDGKTVTLAEALDGALPGLSQMLNITYATIDNKFYLVIDNSLLSMLQAPGVGEILEGLGLNATEILKLFTDLGGYSGIPLEYSDSDGDGVFTFMMKKEQLLPILNIVSPILAGIMPEGFEQLLPALQNAQELELGLPFIKK